MSEVPLYTPNPKRTPLMQVATGDVIYIEANSGAVKRVGRSDRSPSPTPIPCP